MKESIWRSDNLYFLIGILALFLTYLYFDGGRAKEGLMAESLAALIIPSIKFGMGCMACRLKFKYIRPHTLIEDSTPLSNNFWFACGINVIIILAFMFAPL